MTEKKMLLPTDSQVRKVIPITEGVLDYFPLAIAEVAKCSHTCNEQHNPGSRLHWDRSKSTDHVNCIGRHLIDRGSLDTDGVRHSAKLAWRALALLQTELEQEQTKTRSTPSSIIAGEDGWILHNSGDQPHIPPKKRVRLKLKNGRVTQDGYIDDFEWTNVTEPKGYNIVAYQII